MNVNKRNGIIMASCFAIITVLVIIIGALVLIISQQNNYIESANEQITSLEKYALEIKDDNTQLLDEHTALKTIVTDMESAYEDREVEFQQQYDELMEKYNNLYDRISVYEKYEYALYDTEGNRNDITYDQLVLGEQLMLEKGYDPGLLFGSIMVESEGHQDAYNSSSGATGYGQFLTDTGKYVYEELLGNGAGTYDHNTTPKDGTTNIKMMVAYYDYLYKFYKGDTIGVIKSYSGGSSSHALYYYNKVCNYVGYMIS